MSARDFFGTYSPSYIDSGTEEFARLKKIYDKICEFEKAHGSLWKPSPLLKELTESSRSFADFDKTKEA